MRPSGGHLHCLTQIRKPKKKKTGSVELDISKIRAVYGRPKVTRSFPTNLLSTVAHKGHIDFFVAS